MSQSTELTVFTAPSGDRLRVILRDDEPWFVASDVCAALDIANPRDAVSTLEPDEKGVGSTDTPGGIQRKTIVSEPGLYALILRSRKPEAKAFRRWVLHDVLPTIQRSGGYGAAVAQVPQSLPEALRAYAAEVEAREAAQHELEAARPAVAAFETYLDARGAKLVSVVAQEMKTGQNRLFKFLREHRVLKSQPGDTYNLPYQHHVDCGRFTVVAGTRDDRNGDPVATHTTYVTPKGEAYIHKLIEKHGRP